MHTNHRLSWYNERCNFSECSCRASTRHLFWRFSEKLKQTIEVSFFGEILKILGRSQSLHSKLRASAIGEPHLGCISPEGFKLSVGKRHDDGRVGVKGVRFLRPRTFSNDVWILGQEKAVHERGQIGVGQLCLGDVSVT